jgi:hypothetical protein
MRALFLSLVFALTGCVGMNVGDDAGGSASDEYGLNSDQKWQLKSAAQSGSNELAATVARMSWSEPEDTSAFIDYATELQPESAEQIRAAVRGSRPSVN